MRPKKQFVEGTTERMESLLKTADHVNELKRIQSIYFRAKYDIPIEQIADMVGWNVGTVRNIYHYYMKNGEAALRLRGRGGRFHAYLSEVEEAEFLASFMESGQEGDILEISEIPRAYEQKVNKKVPKSTIYRLLDRHDWRKLAPRPKHPKTNTSTMEAFKKTAFPAKTITKNSSL